MTLGKSALRLLVSLALVLLVSGCAGTNDYGAKLPYDAWRLGFFAPDYMEVWIETADAVDTNDRWFKRAMSGVSSISSPSNLKGNPRGWPRNPGDGKGKYVYGADLPRFIYVRWQSLAEPQTYYAYIEIPESARELMVKGERAYCRGTGTWGTEYRKNISIGLAPGGVAKAWVNAPCLDAIEVSRVQGKVVTKGPFEGYSDGKYYRAPNPESQAYIDKFGIPYDSW
ncbi:DUF2931 family protein [Pseudomonas abietaniphila]|uniref:DUF2931 family protein n=1 Tax=Pseudomonas abietaniphila TaxID=89065 RepID=UPI000781F92F|nr:DUF2931 family protein [Pseudomonas abietaniphila]